jgi:hypothetical protein
LRLATDARMEGGSLDVFGIFGHRYVPATP